MFALGLRQCFIANALWMMRKVTKMVLFPANSTVLQNTLQLYLKNGCKVETAGLFLLEEAEKYYTYALRNESLGEAGRKRLEGYIRTVQEKKKQKGL